jgi:hypothetical protein
MEAIGMSLKAHDGFEAISNNANTDASTRLMLAVSSGKRAGSAQLARMSGQDNARHGPTKLLQ